MVPLPEVTRHHSFLHQRLFVEHLQCALDTRDAPVREADMAPCWNGDFLGETGNNQENHTNTIANSKLIGREGLRILTKMNMDVIGI